jgi:hypothetical protein
VLWLIRNTSSSVLMILLISLLTLLTFYYVSLGVFQKKDKTIFYTFELKHDQEVGFCAYTDSKEGNVQLSLVGEHTSSELNISGNFLIYDKFIRNLPKGVYEIHMTSEKSDGITELFIKLKG